MKHDENKLNKEYQVLKCLCHLPRKIVSLHGYENIPEFVLSDLCDESCFNFSKAAYFVDNPDFDCLKGVCGFNNQDLYADQQKKWQDPESFTAHMKSSQFNQKVRNVMRPSLKRNNYEYKEIVPLIAQELAFNNPQSYYWGMKHDNHGLIVFENANGHDTSEYLENGVCLLSLCPIF